MLYPAPNLIDVFMGKTVKPAAPKRVTIHIPSGERISGILDHLDEFAVALHDSSGWVRSFARENVTVHVEDPRRLMKRCCQSTPMTTCITFLLTWRL
jgi:hypothetical protein